MRINSHLWSRCRAWILSGLLLSAAAAAPGAETVRVMSFNLWVGGDACGLGREASLEAQKKAIAEARADIVGLQEQTEKDGGSRAERLAKALGWNHYIISSSRAVISRYPLKPEPQRRRQPDSHHRGSGDNSQAVWVTLPSGKRMLVGVVHLAPAPYQPYEIVDGNLKTSEEATSSAIQTRFDEVRSLLFEVYSELDEGTPVVILGDFNEPSVLDWTSATVATRTDPPIPFGVEWPATKYLQDYGFEDAFRVAHPDPVAKPGYTWTSLAGPYHRTEVMDRIDLILYTGNAMRTREAKVVGEKGPQTDIVVEPWPTDHRAVVAEFEIGAGSSAKEKSKYRYPNPMDRAGVADPSMLLVGDYLYCYSTGWARRGGAYPIRRALNKDRTDWSSVGSILHADGYPEWASKVAYWAPEVHKIGDRYVCYFSARDPENRFHIGVATSMTPDGPFVPEKTSFASDPAVGLIDAAYFQDPVSSRSFVLWKEDANDLNPKKPTGIIMVEASADGMTSVGQPMRLMENDKPWEEDLVEAPTLIYRDGYYYLFFSGNVYSDDRYGVGVARSRKVEGPYEKYAGNPILRSDERFSGPGHQFLYEESPGEWTMFYHARDKKRKYRESVRLLMSDPVRWNAEGWPEINDGTPSEGWGEPDAPTDSGESTTTGQLSPQKPRGKIPGRFSGGGEFRSR